MCTKIAFLSKFYHFYKNFKKLSNIGYTQRIHWIQKKSPAEPGKFSKGIPAYAGMTKRDYTPFLKRLDHQRTTGEQTQIEE